MFSKFTKINQSVFIVILFLITYLNLFAQEAKPFKVRYQGRVNGGMTLIANNIVNREDGGDVANSPYNETTNRGKLNDEFEMKYIDIDNDNATFSSSSATLSLENQSTKKIVYAGLYWSATYLYNSGKLVKKEKFKAIDNKREVFDQIKIKLPNQENYINVSGEVIFDGIDTPNFKESAPYAMYADITQLILKNETPFGTYTVANVKATQGKISGGVSAGWTIFFIYEDSSMKGKFITTYDGFAGIQDHPVDIKFSGFQTVAQGKVNAKIACAALEGDLKLKGDQLLFKASDGDKFIQLSNSLHDKTNIFNCSITIDDTVFDKRIPNSKNTLGYDSFIMTIDNPNNSVIGNNTNGATVRLKTTDERYFIFFNAFEVEDVKPVEATTDAIKEVVQNKIESTNKQLSSSKTTESNKVEKEVVLKEEKSINKSAPQKQIINKETLNSKSDIVSNSKNKVKQTVVDTKKAKTNLSNSISTKQFIRKKAIDSPSVSLPNRKKGYYLVANVFAKKSNTVRFIKSLKAKKIKATYFFNPINRYHYVYISSYDTFEEASKVYDANINGTYFDPLWILTINE